MQSQEKANWHSADGALDSPIYLCENESGAKQLKMLFDNLRNTENI